METMRKISKRYYLRQMVIWVLVNLMFLGIPFGAFAGIGDGGYTLQGGDAIIDAVGGSNNATIDLLTPSAVIGWQNFNTVPGQSVTFDRDGMNFAVLNRVSGGVTNFNGILKGNKGLVIVSNPQGIVFGGSAFVQARSFAAVGSDIDPATFMAAGLGFDPLSFNYTGVTGDIELKKYSKIHVDETLALIGKNVFNRGKIYADEPGAYVVMAAGDTVMISRENSHVNVEVTSSGDNQNWVKNYDDSRLYTDDADGKVSLVLAAGDIYSTAIDGVESLRATALYDADFDSIDVAAMPGSDAVAEVAITTGNSLTIDEDITATAVGNGVDDAYATIDISSGGDLTINSKGSNGTTIEAVAHDGANNSATVELTAEGDVTVSAKDQVTVKAEAYAGKAEAVLNQAQVNIDAGGDVKIKGQDYGQTDAPAHVIASASGAQTNQAQVDIQADGDVLVTGEGREDDGIVSAKAYNGDENHATVVINAVGDVEILSDDYPGGFDGDGAGLVEAWAYNEEGAATLNEADVQITGNNVTIEDRSDGDDGVEVLAIAHNGQTNNATIGITANGEGEESGNVLIADNSAGDDDGVLVKAEAYDGQQNTAAITINATGDVSVLANEGDAGILAYAHDADVSNDASVEITAGGSVYVKSEGGNLVEDWFDTPEYWVIDYHYYWYGTRYDKTKTSYKSDHDVPGYATIDNVDHYDAVHTLINSSFTPYVASVEAIAENAGSSNTAGVDITAGHNAVVLAKNGGEAFVSAYTGNALDSVNTSNVNITAEDGYVLVHAIGGQWSTEDGFTASEASVEATAENAGGPDGTNSANITIVARDVIDEPLPTDIDGDSDDDITPAVVLLDSDGDSDNDAGDVMVIGVNGGKAEIEAIAKDGGENTATVDIEADSDVMVIALCEGQPSQAEVTAVAKYGITNTAGIDITAGEDVKVLAKNGGKAEVEAIAKYADVSNSANIGIEAGDDVKVLAFGSDYGQYSDATVNAEAEYANSNTAGITIGAGDDVKVIAKDGADAEVKAKAKNAYNVNTASVGIVAGGDVKVIADGYGSGPDSEASIVAKATNRGDLYDYAGELIPVPVVDTDDDMDSDVDYYIMPIDGIENTASVDITAASVKVKGEDRGQAVVEAKAGNKIYINDVGPVKTSDADGDDDLDIDVVFGNMTNTATVDITATDGDVVVIGKDGGEASVDAEAWNEACGRVPDYLNFNVDGVLANNAGVAIDAAGKVLVMGKDGGEADVYAETWNEYEGDIEILSGGSNSTSTVTVNAGDGVKVLGIHGDAWIEALAYDGSTNNASVAIDTPGNVKVKAAGCEAGIYAEAAWGIDNTASVALGGIGHKIGGDVDVIAEHGEAYIEADAHDAWNSNDAGVLICTEGQLTVQAGELCGEDSYGSKDASIGAYAEDGLLNSASVEMCAEDGIAVLAFGDHSDASIEAKAKDGYDNEAYLNAHTYGDVIVGALDGGEAKIRTKASDGSITDAKTYVCATGDIIVSAAEFGYGQMGPQFTLMGGQGGMCGSGASAQISSEARSEGYGEETSAIAETHVVSKEGGVAVLAVGMGCYGPQAEAGVTSMATGGTFNTSYTGIAAGAELTPASLPVLFDGGEPTLMMGPFDMSQFLVGNVFVGALGNAEAEVSSGAFGCGAVKNDAMTVICAPGKIVVASGFGGEARVSSMAFGAAENSAQTKVYAGAGELGSDIVVMGRGASIGAATPDNFMCITQNGQVAYGEGDSALVIVGDYASREDCPECPPCPCEEQGTPVGPAAAIYTETGEPLEKPEFEQGGCPALMQWFSSEVGLPLDQIHVVLGNADYLATDIQPCESCARLKQQSDAMASLDAAQVNAWASTVRAGLVGPISPEMMDGIRTALADNPAAMGFDEAAAEYVKTLNEDLGFGREDAVALVTSKYAPNSADLDAYISARAGQ